MPIERDQLERDLASVRAQREKAFAVLHEAIGAEKAITEMLRRLDEKEPEDKPAAD